MPKRLKPKQTTIAACKRHAGSPLAYLNVCWDGKQVIPPTKTGDLV